MRRRIADRWPWIPERWRGSALATLLPGVIRVAATRGLGTILQFTVAIVLGGGAGPAVLGAYFLYLAWSSILGKAFGLGHSTAIMREAGRAAALPGTLTLERTLRHSTRVVAIAGAAGLVAVLVAGEPVLAALGVETPPVAILAAAGLGGLATALSKLASDALKGLHRAHLGLFYEFDLPLILFLGILLAAPVFGVPLGPVRIISAHALSMAVVTALSLVKARNEAATVTAPGSTGDAGRSPLKLVHGAYWGVSGVNHLFAVAPYVVLPFFATSAEIGVFGVVHRLVAIAGTLQVALGSFFAPRFVGDGERTPTLAVRRAFHLSQLCSVLLYLPFCAAYLLFPGQILGLFGDEFPALASLLVLLGALRLGNAVVGPAEYLLSMSGHGRLELASGAVGVALFFLLSLALHDSGAGVHEVGLLFGIAFLVRGLLSLGIIYALAYAARGSRGPDDDR